MRSSFSKSSGFTLIELLVVVAIIGILASVVLASLSAARGKSRDARRRVDLKQIQTALELYYSDNNAYPITSGAQPWWGTCSGWGSHSTSGATGWVPNLAPAYIAVLPVDPNPVGTTGCYIYRSLAPGNDYKLLAYTTVENPITSSDPMWDGIHGGNSYAIWTPGATGALGY